MDKCQKKLTVNTKAIYAAGGGIAAVAIAIFFVLGTGNLRPPGSQNPDSSNPQAQPEANLEIAIRNITATSADDKNANVQISFTAHNPNTSTVTLETIHYTLYVGEFRMTSGDIGVSPEGFLAGQPDTFPIVSGSTITLRDKQVATKNNLTTSAWDSMVEGTAKYRVEGNYAYRVTGGNFQTNYYPKEFNMTFP